MRTFSWIVITIVVTAVIFRLTCGIFVQQPIGILPKGITIVYWRVGTNLPFVTSIDGFLLDNDIEVNLLGRAMALGTIGKVAIDHSIIRLGYSENLYLYSTGGKTFK